jgi:CheY-like chemotaxis protein
VKIMIIEDDVSIRDMLHEILSDEGYTTMMAGDGRQGLELLRESEPVPDLILLDLAMPVMSGWELLTTLDDDPQLASIPVVILSADTSVAKQQRFGPRIPVLSKPVDLDVLLSLITSYESRE